MALTLPPFPTRSQDRTRLILLGTGGGPRPRGVEVIEYEELGMEAIFRIDVESFPAFIVIDDKGNDFFSQLS